MATIVCQCMQSCLESQLAEPRTLRLKLSAPIAHHFSAAPLELGIKSCFSSESNKPEEKCHYDKPTSKNSDLGGWSFLQAITNSSQGPATKLEDKENMYFPPQVKHSSATKLTEKSLELCTENLGNESGTIFIENNFFSESAAESMSMNVQLREQQKQRQVLGGKRGNVHNFPPPLTTISGSESVQVRPHREEGRLIMKVVKTPVTQTCFQAERSNGRLRLCFLRNFAPHFDSEETATQENSEGNSTSGDNENEACENDRNEEEEEDRQEEKEVVVGEKEDLVEGEGQNCLIHEEVDGNSFNVGGEDHEGMEKFGRPSRCKEGGHEREKKGLLNWEPFWVAT